MARPPAPMLASPAGTLPKLDDWTIEPKWDGYRVIADVGAKGAHLWSRNGIDKAQQFPDVAEALETLAREQGSLMLDGELVAIDRAGKPLRFQALQGRAERTAFVAFDVLSASRKDVRALPWHARREVLESVVPKSAKAIVRLGPTARCGSAGAKKLIAAAQSEGWEGLIVKQVDSLYASGQRSPMWRKVKLEHEQEFVIGGYTLPTEGAARSHFGALLVGYYDDEGKLRYAGKVGTGYTHSTLETLGKKLGAIERPTSPFSNAPAARGSVWVKPQLVAQIKYNEMTNSGVLRQPAFLGLRDDKKARDVSLEAGTTKSAILDALRCGK